MSKTRKQIPVPTKTRAVFGAPTRTDYIEVSVPDIPNASLYVYRIWQEDDGYLVQRVDGMVTEAPLSKKDLPEGFNNLELIGTMMTDKSGELISA